MTLAVNNVRFGHAGQPTRERKYRFIVVVVAMRKLAEQQDANVNASVMFAYASIKALKPKQIIFLLRKKKVYQLGDTIRLHNLRQVSNKSTLV